MRYRRKPIEVDAEQWFPPGDDRHKHIDCAEPHSIGTNNGVRLHWYAAGVRLIEGNWIVTRGDGERTVMSAVEFAQLYEPA